MGSETLKWRKVANGIWKARLGAKAGASLLKHSGVPMARESLKAMEDAQFPFAKDAISLASRAGRLILEIPYLKQERLYGLGLNFKRIEVQGSIRHLHSDHFNGSDNGRTHAPTPFYVSSAGYGVFVDLARYMDVYAGCTNRKESHPPVVDRFPVKPSKEVWRDVQPGNSVEISMPEPGADVYVFSGPSPLEVVRRFNLLCGGGCLPPVWGLGFSHRVPVTFTDSEVEDEVAKFKERGFPLDVLGLEPGWHSQSYPNSYEWNKSRFPDPAALAGRLLKDGIRLNLWENADVAPESKLGRQIKPLAGSHTAGWGGLVPDFSLEKGRRAFAQFHEKEHISIGVSGYKLDECDGYDQWLWPDHAEFPSGLSGEELRQLYGTLYQRTLTEAFHRSGRRTYGLVRASNAGAVSFPFVLYNDYYGHRDFVTALCSSSFCGTLWTPEARSSKTPDEWLRRIQTTCMSPMAMLNAWCDGTKPWSFPEVSDAVKEAILLRMRLVPYIYTAFAKYRSEGVPPFRAMALVEGFPVSGSSPAKSGKLDSTENPYATAAPDDVRDQYMIGPDLLVAPLFEGDKSRKVLLPDGRWYDFHSGAFAGEGFSEIEVVAAKDGKMPLFVRDGGIIPLAAPSSHAPSTSCKTPLEIRHYGEAEGVYELYDDDGESFDYESGASTWTRLSVSRDKAGRLAGKVETVSGGRSYLYGKLSWRFMGS